MSIKTDLKIWDALFLLVIIYCEVVKGMIMMNIVEYSSDETPHNQTTGFKWNKTVERDCGGHRVEIGLSWFV